MSDEVKKGTHSTGNVPRKEADLIGVATTAAMSWRKSELSLAWTDPDRFETKVETYSNTFELRNSNRGERRIITQNRDAVNAEINGALKYVKNYIAEMFGTKNVTAYYEKFGIARERNSSYVIPGDSDSRLRALQQLIKALVQYGMGDRKYGAAYWEDLYMRCAQASSEAVASDSTTARQVATKADLKAEIITTLNALIHLIKANYPHSAREEIRAWGFQKEKY